MHRCAIHRAPWRSAGRSGASSYQPALREDDVCSGDDARCALSALQHSQWETSNMTSSSSLARQSMQAVLREAALMNATQAVGPARVATFKARAKGLISLVSTPIGVLVGTDGVKIQQSLVEEICGEKSGDGDCGFKYHIHNFWLSHHKKSSYGDQCGPKFTGQTWDPTAACGPKSGNAVCSTCFNAPYVCNPKDYKWWDANQYRADSVVACQFGDLSGMFGTLKLKKAEEEYIKTKNIWGIAQMSALKGVIYNDDTCKPEKPGYIHASSTYGLTLNELSGKSIVVACPRDYENAGAPLICAKLI